MGTRKYQTSVTVPATKDAVWAVVRDVESWPRWTPTMSSVRCVSDERGVVGAAYEIKQPGLAKSVLVVDEWNEGRSFSWSSTAAGVRTRADHLLTDVGPDRTAVTLSFEVHGPGAGLVWAFVGRKIRRYVDTEASSLKAIWDGVPRE